MKKHVVNHHVTIFQSELFQTNAAVIQTTDCVIIVDPTWLAGEVEEIRQYVENIQGERPLYLIFTHSDWDHIIGYGAFPNAITIGSQEMTEIKNKEEILHQIDEFDQKNYIQRPYEIKYPILEQTVQHDGETLLIGKTKLTFYKAKGHTGDGIFTIIEPLGILIAGDYLSDVEPPYIYFSSYEYEETLKKTDSILENHHIQLYIPGHGNATDSVEEIKTRQQEGFHYIHELRKYITEGKTEEETVNLYNKYLFPKGIQSYHSGNYKLVKEELNK